MFKIYDGREQFFQWDIDRKLIVDDSSITQVHFCNRTDNCSLVCETYVEDGVTVVNVPNILLQTSWRIRAYAYDGKHTKHEECFDVVARTKPADYVYTETEILNYENLLNLINELDENLADTVQQYLKDNPVSVDLTGYYTKDEVDAAIEQIELTPGAKGDKGDKGEPGYTPIKGIDYFDGEPGAPGEPGKDGYTPVKGVDYFDGTPGKDGEPGKDGYTPVKGVDYFDGKDGEPGAPGKDGQDYVLTEADKQEIASMVEVSGGGDVDLSDYYTKEEINDLLSNLPVGDLPSGEGVEF